MMKIPSPRALLLVSILVCPGLSLAQPLWHWQNPMPQGNPLRAVSFLDRNKGGAVGDYGIILRTSDGGSTWTVQLSGIFTPLRCAFCIDSATITVAGDGGTILRTTDGGGTWTSQLNGSISDFTDVAFIDASHGIAVGDETLWTSDGGEEWISRSDRIPLPVNQVFLFDSSRVTVIGSGGMILSRSVTGSPVSVARERSLPQCPYLDQNYPDPFNSSTTLRFSLPYRASAQLAVFNTLGQQVAILVQEEKEAGAHEVHFDASRLSTGVYFYRLTAGSFVRTRRALLLR